MQWWKNKEAGKYILELIEPGTESSNADFETIDPTEYIEFMTHD